MTDEKEEKLELPPEPISPVKQSLLYSVTIGALGAIAGGLLGKLFGMKNKEAINKAVDYGSVLAGVGLSVGYSEGKRDIAERELKIENIKLKRELAKVKSDKSYIKQIDAETPTSECRTR